MPSTAKFNLKCSDDSLMVVKLWYIYCVDWNLNWKCCNKQCTKNYYQSAENHDNISIHVINIWIVLVKNGDLFNEHHLPISFKRVQHIDQSQHWHILQKQMNVNYAAEVRSNVWRHSATYWSISCIAGWWENLSELSIYKIQILLLKEEMLRSFVNFKQTSLI